MPSNSSNDFQNDFINKNPTEQNQYPNQNNQPEANQNQTQNQNFQFEEKENSQKNTSVQNKDKESDVKFLTTSKESKTDSEKERDFYLEASEKDFLNPSNVNQSQRIFHTNLNQIIQESGYNLSVWTIIFFTLLFLFIQGFMLTYYNNIITAFKDFHKISDSALGLIGSSLYVGMASGCGCTGILLNFMDRRQIIIMSGFFIALSNVLSGIGHNLALFVICRFVGAIFLGFYQVIFLAMLTEYLPVKFRGFILNIVWCAWSFGASYFLFFCKIYLPKLTYHPWDENFPYNFNMAIFSVSYVSIANFFLVYFFLRDSPRNLLVNHKIEEAGQILDSYVNRKLTKEELEIIYQNVQNTGENNKNKEKNENTNKDKYKMLFSRRYVKITVIMSVLNFIYSFCLVGLGVALPIILKKRTQKKENKNFEEAHAHSDINSLIWFYMLLIPAIASVMAEMKFIGKKYSVILMTLVSIIFAELSMIYMDSHFRLKFFISSMLLNNALDLQVSWGSEVLPTKIRDVGLGIFQMSNRLGGIFAQFIFLILVHINTKLTILTYIICLVICVCIISFLPKNEIEELDSELENNFTETNTYITENDIERSYAKLSKEFDTEKLNERRRRLFE